MGYKQYIRELEQQLEAYKYFSDENLELLKVSLDLSIVSNELWERAQKFRGREEYDELMEFVEKINDAKKGYDTMYTKYNLSTRALDELRLTATALGRIVMDYELEDLQGLKL
jgi:uncharacterized coiled-coil DUF342 family protein